MPAREIFLVLAEFGRAREQASLALLTATLGRAFPGASLRGAIVDNALAGDVAVEIAEDITRVSGDNTLHEFSAWDRGIAWLDRRYAPAPESTVVLANDTVVRCDKHDRVAALPADRAAAAAGGTLVGWIDEYPAPVSLFGLALRQWVDTSLVLTSRRTLSSLAPLARPEARAVVFASECGRLFREPSPLSSAYRAYLESYFTGSAAAPGFDHRWHAQATLTSDNFDAVTQKLRCVFCEHLLSARARALGIPLADIRPIPLPIDPRGEAVHG